MKKITYLIVVFLAIFAFNNCSDDIAGTEDLNYITFEVGIPTIVVELGGSTSIDVKVYSTLITGSDRSFNVEIDSDVTTANAESYSLSGTVTIPANSNTGTVTITATDNNLGEDPVVLGLKIGSGDELFTGSTAEITIQKHCTLNINDFVGTYSGETEGEWGPTQVVTSLDENGNLQITGVGVAFLTGYWGEEITSMATLPVNVDLETGDFTIDLAAYITTIYNGEVQPTYYLTATGNLNACSGTMYLYYDFVQGGTSYVEYFESQTKFTEIISIN